MNRWSAFLAALVLAGCAAPDARPAPLRDGIATVRLGGAARFGHVVLTPVRIEEDSRCPTGVQCVWAGTVRVAVYVADNGERVAHPIIMTLGEPLPMEGGGGVTLVGACPYPAHPNSIRKEDYRLTFALGVSLPPRANDSGFKR